MENVKTLAFINPREYINMFDVLFLIQFDSATKWTSIIFPNLIEEKK